MVGQVSGAAAYSRREAVFKLPAKIRHSELIIMRSLLDIPVRVGGNAMQPKSFRQPEQITNPNAACAPHILYAYRIHWQIMF